jgi:YD repeat-containing protein
VGYGYDPAGNRTTLTYPSGQSVLYGFDTDERMSSVVLRLILHHGFAAKLHQPFAAKVHQASRDG